MVLHRPFEPTALIRWDEKAGLHGMRYAPNNRRARSTRERRPAVKKISTVAKCGNEIFEEPKLTIGLDLGDRAIHYCILDEAGKVILEHSLPTTPKGIQQVFSRIPRSRIALETGTHSPWVSRQLTHEHHYHPTQAEIHTKTYVLPMGTKVPVRTEATMFSTPTATWSFPWCKRSDRHSIGYEEKPLSWHLRPCAGSAIDFGWGQAIPSCTA